MLLKLSGAKIIPASFFGTPLGLIALGLAWRSEAAESEFKDAVQCCFVGLAGVVALLASIGLAPQVPKLAAT
jgi:tellurite resistance protein TehA-like permease